jgi:hypothetical protein
LIRYTIYWYYKWEVFFVLFYTQGYGVINITWYKLTI